MKVKTEPGGTRWCLLSSTEAKKLADACSIAQGIALVERHDVTGQIAQKASDALAELLESRQPPGEDIPV